MRDNKPVDRGEHKDRVLRAIGSANAAATSMVAASWARSVHLHGLSPDRFTELQRHEERDLGHRRARLDRLLHVSPSSLDRLYGLISLTGCGLFLCDTEGVILEQRRGAGDESDFDKAGLTTGADWSEKHQGTNGIGTCIVESRPVSIHFDQHFSSSNTVMSCMGAPIFGTDGELTAVLDVSSCRQDLDKSMASLISNAVGETAGQIEADHFCDRFAAMRILRGQGDRQRAPVLLAVDKDDLVVGATRAARKAYGLPVNAKLAPKPASDFLGDTEARGVGFDSAERRELSRAIARANGNMTAAAKSLNISRATLYRRMQKLGIGDN